MCMEGQIFLQHQGKKIATSSLVKRPEDILQEVETHIFTNIMLIAL